MWRAGVLMIKSIKTKHYEHILKINEAFVHWLAPLDLAQLEWVLSIATYKRQVDDAQAVLFGYPYDANYPEHKNLIWLNRHVSNFFYIDRIIVDACAQGRGYGKLLYQDVEDFARQSGYSHMTCEVNTVPNNPSSHAFHLAMGYTAIGDEDYPDYDSSLRYYKKAL